MKTIEERANEIFENYPNPYEMPDDTCAYFDGEQVVDMMVKIATDQKKIDADSMHAIMEENVIKAIEKQRQIDNEHLERIVSQWKREETLWIERHNEIQKQMIDKAWEFMCTHYVVGMEYDDFVKAMEK